MRRRGVAERRGDVSSFGTDFPMEVVLKLTIVVGVALLWPAITLPAQDIRPLDAKVGLWESSTTTEMSGRAMPAMPQIPEAALARMTPEQRAKMEAMMKSRAGGTPMTTKVCITKE